MLIKHLFLDAYIKKKVANENDYEDRLMKALDRRESDDADSGDDKLLI